MPRTTSTIITVLIVFGSFCISQHLCSADEPTKTLRAGIIGLDTSHSVKFPEILQKSDNTGYMAKVKIVAAYHANSDVEKTADIAKENTQKVKEMGVEIVDSIPALLEKVDVVLLESVDGRMHLEQAIPVFKAGKPVFIDKPLGGTLAEAIAIQELGNKYKTPWFSSSSLRFYPGVLNYRGKNEKTGNVLGADVWAPCSLEPHHPDLFWYGIHGCETLFTVMGSGCQAVSRTQTETEELVTGVWNKGRIGTFRGIRPPGKRVYGAIVFGDKGVAQFESGAAYAQLLERVTEFFHTLKPPVDVNETLEIYAFMEAADESKRQGGKQVSLKEVMEKAKKDAAQLLEKIEAKSSSLK